VPPLLALDWFSVRTKWIAALAALAVALAAVFWNDLRGLVPTASDRSDWDAADLAAAPPAEAVGLGDGIDDRGGSAQLTATGAVIDLVWEADLAVTAVRFESYEDAFGTGLRFAVAADTATEGGPHCLNARITTGDGPVLLQSCVRGDRHGPPDMAAFLGKEDEDGWRADHLFLTQTANLDPAAIPMVDYYGLGFDTGDADESGLWGPNSWWPQPDLPPECGTDPGLMLRLDDLHLTDRYADPAEHTGLAETAHEQTAAFPAEDRLLLSACVPVGTGIGGDVAAVEPFTATGPVPLSRWAQFNAASAGPQPLRTAVAVDLRTCDADSTDRCSSDGTGDGPPRNSGTASDWMGELLDR
jgi:hypothetical protein